jgi:hypothetical protein
MSRSKKFCLATSYLEAYHQHRPNRSSAAASDTPQPFNTVLADKKLEVTYQIVKEQIISA